MSIFSNFDGSASRRNIRSGRNAGREIYSQQGQTYGQQYASAQGRLEPFAQTGQRANTLYGNALGINGRDAQTQFYSDWQNDPGHDFNVNRSTQAVERRLNASGYGGSGMAALASARAAQEMEQDQYRYRMGQLQGLQGQGAQIGNSLASLDTGYANQMGNLTNQRANNATQAASALASTQSMGMQNALGLGSLALGAFVPGAAGISAAGSFGAGVNSLLGGGRSPAMATNTGSGYVPPNYITYGQGR